MANDGATGATVNALSADAIAAVSKNAFRAECGIALPDSLFPDSLFPDSLFPDSISNY
jgi:hypothetical protein